MRYVRRHYPARFKRLADGTYLVTFRDVPEAITEGKPLSVALAMAADVLGLSLQIRIETGADLPRRTLPRKDERPIAVVLFLIAKVAGR